MGVRPAPARRGAAAGVGIDLMTGGLTWAPPPPRRHRRRPVADLRPLRRAPAAKLRGHRELTVDDAILRIVALRQRSLLVALTGAPRRGEADRARRRARRHAANADR